MKKLILSSMILCLILIGCAAPQSNTGKGATYGAAGGAVAGAVLGQAIGRDTESTLIGAAAGAAVGAAAGAGVGHMMDKQEAEMRQALAASEEAAVRREGDLLAITLKGDVSFDYNSDVVRPGLYNELDRIAQIMVKYPQTSIENRCNFMKLQISTCLVFFISRSDLLLRFRLSNRLAHNFYP
jgi:hypothetical protein